MTSIGILITSLFVSVAAIDLETDWSQFDTVMVKITTNHSLDAQASRLARRAAAGFFYAGACKGVGFEDAMDAIAIIKAADPGIPWQAAALEMLGVYSRVSFGPTDNTICAKAFQDASN